MLRMARIRAQSAKAMMLCSPRSMRRITRQLYPSSSPISLLLPDASRRYPEHSDFAHVWWRRSMLAGSRSLGSQGRAPSLYLFT